MMNTEDLKLYGQGNGVKKPTPKNWIHSDDRMQEGVEYNVLVNTKRLK